MPPTYPCLPCTAARRCEAVSTARGVGMVCPFPLLKVPPQAQRVATARKVCRLEALLSLSEEEL